MGRAQGDLSGLREGGEQGNKGCVVIDNCKQLTQNQWGKGFIPQASPPPQRVNHRERTQVSGEPVAFACARLQFLQESCATQGRFAERPTEYEGQVNGSELSSGLVPQCEHGGRCPSTLWSFNLPRLPSLAQRGSLLSSSPHLPHLHPLYPSSHLLPTLELPAPLTAHWLISK